VANNGLLYDLKLERLEEQPYASSFAVVSEKTLSLIKDALVGVVSEKHGTGWAAKSRLTEVAGKTGTSQVISFKKRREIEKLGRMKARFEDHAWFVAFAPEEEPEIALSVFVEHGGHGGTAAAPIAKKTIEAYMASLKKNAENRPKTDN
jgi:penicillin-binding protein 2